jgi:hypothetical protein
VEGGGGRGLDKILDKLKIRCKIHIKHTKNHVKNEVRHGKAKTARPQKAIHCDAEAFNSSGD